MWDKIFGCFAGKVPKEACKRVKMSDIQARVPPNQMKQFKQFVRQHEMYQSRVQKYPTELPQIDWQYYRSNVRDDYVEWVDGFQKQYDKLKDIFENRHQYIDITTYFDEVDKEKEKVKVEIEEFKKKSNERIQDLEDELACRKSLTSAKDMTMEEFCEAYPDDAQDFINKPSFWPHTPDEQRPGPTEVHVPQEPKEGVPPTGDGTLPAQKPTGGDGGAPAAPADGSKTPPASDGKTPPTEGKKPHGDGKIPPETPPDGKKPPAGETKAPPAPPAAVDSKKTEKTPDSTKTPSKGTAKPAPSDTAKPPPTADSTKKPPATSGTAKPADAKKTADKVDSAKAPKASSETKKLESSPPAKKPTDDAKKPSAASKAPAATKKSPETLEAEPKKSRKDSTDKKKPDDPKGAVQASGFKITASMPPTIIPAKCPPKPPQSVEDLIGAAEECRKKLSDEILKRSQVGAVDPKSPTKPSQDGSKTKKTKMGASDTSNAGTQSKEVVKSADPKSSAEKTSSKPTASKVESSTKKSSNDKKSDSAPSAEASKAKTTTDQSKRSKPSGVSKSNNPNKPNDPSNKPSSNPPKRSMASKAGTGESDDTKKHTGTSCAPTKYENEKSRPVEKFIEYAKQKSNAQNFVKKDQVGDGSTVPPPDKLICEKSLDTAAVSKEDSLKMEKTGGSSEICKKSIIEGAPKKTADVKEEHTNLKNDNEGKSDICTDTIIKSDEEKDAEIKNPLKLVSSEKREQIDEKICEKKRKSDILKETIIVGDSVENPDIKPAHKSLPNEPKSCELHTSDSYMEIKANKNDDISDKANENTMLGQPHEDWITDSCQSIFPPTKEGIEVSESITKETTANKSTVKPYSEKEFKPIMELLESINELELIFDGKSPAEAINTEDPTLKMLDGAVKTFQEATAVEKKQLSIIQTACKQASLSADRAITEATKAVEAAKKLVKRAQEKTTSEDDSGEIKNAEKHAIYAKYLAERALELKKETIRVLRKLKKEIKAGLRK